MTVDSAGFAGRLVLATKLHVPGRRPGVVTRQRLSARLTTANAGSLTLVSAPAGFGKTTLLTEWLAGSDDATVTAWVSLDSADNDPATFWTYVIAAVQGVRPDVGDNALRTLESGQPLPSVVAALLNDLHDRAGGLVIVLDDYHVIESTEIHESNAYLIDHAPPSLHLVIASRSDPPIPLGRLRARGQLTEVRAADLRFTPDETFLYLNDTMGLRLGAGDVDSLGARTEGWIAALQLAALSLQGRDDVEQFIANFTGDDRFVVDYLVEEVLDRQTAAMRTFLLRTSVLDRLTGALCDAVTESTDGRATLEQLDRSNMFLVALDDRRHWYRYHHLFADVLRARLADEAPDVVSDLHRRASAWYAAHGEPIAAIDHALAGDDVVEAARLIELTAPRLRQSRQEGLMRRWLEALPAEVFVDRPVLTISLVGARMATGDPTGVEPLLQMIEASLARTSPPPVVFDVEMFDRLPTQVLVQRAGLALLAGDLEATIDYASRALALVEPADHLRRGSATVLLALAQWGAGDLEHAVRGYTDGIAAFVAADYLSDALGCSLALADIQIALGKLSEAKQTFDNGLRWTTERPGLRGAADMHAGLSEVLIERNLLDDAARHLAISRELEDSAGLPQHAYRWRVAMARLRRAQGDLDAALELIDEAVHVYNTDYSPPVRPVAAIKARVLLGHGDLDAAVNWTIERGLTVDDELSYVHEYEHVTLARVLIARQTGTALDDAIRLLNRLLTAAQGGSRMGTVIEVQILLATANHAKGNIPAAIAALESALDNAAPEGHVRLFLHAGPAVTDLLRTLAFGSQSTSHARHVLAAIDVTDSAVTPAAPDARPAPNTALVDELSNRELDVLRLLRSDLSGPDIARQMHISMNTLRTHTKNIYTKLGATSRREAVTRATQLGL